MVIIKLNVKYIFFEGRLFFYNYTFSHLQKHQTSEIIDVLKEKYIVGTENDLKEAIIDSFNNCIQVNYELETSINYISLNCKFFKDISTLSDIKSEHEKRKNNLQYRDIYSKL